MLNVAVIGAGVNGITSAYVIQEHFGSDVQVTIFATETSPQTTGDISAGLWSPYLLGSTPAEKISKWAKGTLNFFHKLWKSGSADEAGISLQSIARVDKNPKGFEPSKWAYMAYGCNKMLPWQIAILNREHGEIYTGGMNFVAFICEPSKFLPFLTKKIIKNGGKIIKQTIGDFKELKEYDLIINCAGIGSRELCNDTTTLPIRGQICRVKAPWIYQVFLDDSDEGNYVIPNSDCVILGGTHQENDFDTNVRENDTNVILLGCYNINASLKNAEIIKHQVGLRPGRENVRLDTETIKIKNKPLTIIHNYGHGGSGVTLCFGCALDVLNLAISATNNINMKHKL